MTRKDYQVIAAALYEARMSVRERAKLAGIIAAVCLKDNANFDTIRFFQAAGCNASVTRIGDK